MTKRIYSEQEVARLIRRAVELEAKRSGEIRSGANEGLTIQDLEKIAAGSGIDPELMRRAASELHEKDSVTDFGDTTKISNSEILAEHWIKANVDSQVLDDLILELNHRFGTSQKEITWWNKLFDDYSGKAIVNKTSTSVEWKYTDELEMYTTRVLIQQRGDKLRIRVSKRQAWNISWNSEGLNIFFALLSAILITGLGAVLGFTILDSPTLGIVGGLALSALAVPLYLKFNRHRLNSHKKEVTDISETLVIQAKQMTSESDNKQAQKDGSGNTDTRAIELDIEEPKSADPNPESSKSLRNHLRE